MCLFRKHKMFSVYILFSETTNRFYTGQCIDLIKRMDQHNSGRNKSTKNGIPWRVVFVKQCITRTDAVRLERKIKDRGAFRYLNESETAVG